MAHSHHNLWFILLNHKPIVLFVNVFYLSWLWMDASVRHVEENSAEHCSVRITLEIPGYVLSPLPSLCTAGVPPCLRIWPTCSACLPLAGCVGITLLSWWGMWPLFFPGLPWKGVWSPMLSLSNWYLEGLIFCPSPLNCAGTPTPTSSHRLFLTGSLCVCCCLGGGGMWRLWEHNATAEHLKTQNQTCLCV